MKTRSATPEEILAQFAPSISRGEKVRYRGFVRERAMRTARNGVQHIEYFWAQILIIGDKPTIKVGDRFDELTATMVEIPSDARSETRKECMIDLRIKSEYLK